MDQKHYLLKGTALLTGAGLFTRLAGFFYKIFLSRTIGAQQIGLFQLATPVCALCIAFAIGGIQTAVSRFTAEYHAKNDRHGALFFLACSLVLSLTLSCLCAAGLSFFALPAAKILLLEPLCAPLLRILAVSLPFCAIHACVSGYFIGCKNVAVPAISQILEQFARISSVLLFFALFSKSRRTMDSSVMALGQIAGEVCSSLFCMYHLLYGKQAPTLSHHPKKQRRKNAAFRQTAAIQYRKLLPVAAPLGMNRTLLCVLHGIEAALLPQQLQRFGLDSHASLALYGTLTGMTMPLLLFPTAITGAVGTLLLPAVSEANALKHDHRINATVNTSFQASIILGMFCMAAFLLFGRDAGVLLFGSAPSGMLLQKLALLCPFLYLNTTLVSIVHGLGKSTAVFLWNIAGASIRIAAVVFFVPAAGIDAYLAGSILSQIFISVCTILLLYHCRALTANIIDVLLRCGLICLISGGSTVWFLYKQTTAFSSPVPFPVILAAVCIYCTAFALGAWRLVVPKKHINSME